jgi:GSH-dependent disulfide-bond oxidoreductase
MLEEIGLPYEAHYVNFDTNDQGSEEFRSLNPYGKIPALIDPKGPDGAPLPLFESAAILIYLAEKTGKLLPSGAARYETLQWLAFQVGGVGPMFGQVGYFYKFDGRHFEDKRPLERYVTQSRRILEVMNGQLASCRWLAGNEYTIADIATFPWVRNLITFYGAGDLVGIADFAHVQRALDGFLARPAVIRGLAIPAKA